jgi:hypothetical protein
VQNLYLSHDVRIDIHEALQTQGVKDMRTNIMAIEFRISNHGYICDTCFTFWKRTYNSRNIACFALSRLYDILVFIVYGKEDGIDMQETKGE